MRLNLFFLVGLSLILFSCTPEDGVDGRDGAEGFSIGIQSVDIDSCKQITFFKDSDNDGFFDDEEEIIDSFLVCSGENGINGKDGQDGVDGQDGADGQNGVDGDNGADGQDGISIGLVSISLGQGCNRLTFFYDTNYNNSLEEGENTIAIIDLCDGEDGIDGVDGADGQDATTSSTKVTINGVAQKGPFLNGSSVIISELDADYSQTGKSFNVQIEDNSGKFNIRNIPLVSNYINTRVDGFYYNEITGKKSNSQITLNGIVDIAENKAVNLNVLTHLEKARVEYLLANTTLTFKQVKDKAQEEILSIFEISSDSVSLESEKLNIASGNKESRVLLAVSSILQGYRTEAEFSSLLADIISDIKTDGTLDVASNGSQLISHAKAIDPSSIKTNVEARYTELNESATVGNFSNIISNFIQNTEYVDNVDVIDFPSTLSNGGINVLGAMSDTLTIDDSKTYYFVANLPVKEMVIKLHLKAITYGHTSGGSIGTRAGFGYNTAPTGWLVSNYSYTEDPNQIFTSSLQNTNARVIFSDSWIYRIQIFVNNNTTPYKTIFVKNP